MAKLKLGYTVIQHGPRIHHGLSMNQYALASAIFHLASNPENPVLGWCWASKKNLAAYFGFTSRTAFNLINELVTAGWLERHPNQQDGANGLVRASARWYREIECWTGEKDTSGLPPSLSADPVKNLHTPPVKSIHTPYENFAHNSNTDTNRVDTDVFSAQARTKKNRGKNTEIEPFLDAQAPAADAPPVAAVPPKEEPTQRSPEVQALLDDMADYWDVSATRFFHDYALLARFLTDQEKLGELPFVSDQYHAYRAARNVQPHNLDNYLGKPENGWLGAWNKKDYTKMLTKKQALDPNGGKDDGKLSHLGQRQNGANAAAQRLLDKHAARIQNQNPA